ncbi:MAG: hypothetical protein ABIH68_05615 [bacterium]
MSYGGFFAVGEARVFETYLMPPFLLRRAFETEKYSDAMNIVKSGSFGRLLNEKESDFGLGGFLKKMAASFAEVSQEPNAFTLNQTKFVKFLKACGNEPAGKILSVLRGSRDPFEFYGFLYEERRKRLGRIEGFDVLLFVWLSLWWQTRLVRMILSSKKKGVKVKDVSG